MGLLRRVHARQRSRYRLSIWVSSMLLNMDTGIMGHFYGSRNTELLRDVPYISSYADIEDSVRTSLEKQDLIEVASSPRTDTNTVVLRIPTIVIRTYASSAPAIGCAEDVDIPTALRGKRCLNTLISNQRGDHFSDYNCFFRALSIKRKRGNIEEAVEEYRQQWLESNGIDDTNFTGIFLQDLPALEHLFSVKITVLEYKDPRAEVQSEIDDDNEEAMEWEEDEFQPLDDIEQMLEEDEGDPYVLRGQAFLDANREGDEEMGQVAAEPDAEPDVEPDVSENRFSIVYPSCRKTGDSLNLLLLDGRHFALITNMNRLCRSYVCPGCHREFNDISNYNRHVKNKISSCPGGTKEKFTAGGFANPPGLFDKIAEAGLNVPFDDWDHPYFGVFDCETMFNKIGTDPTIADPADDVEPLPEKKLVYNSTLTPISIGIQSNLPGVSRITGQPFNEPFVAVDEDPLALNKTFFDLMQEMSEVQYGIMTTKHVRVHDFLKAQAECALEKKRGLEAYRRSIPKDKTQHSNDQRLILRVKSQAWFNSKKFVNLLQQFENHCRRIVMLGYNSQKFDLTVLNPYFLTHAIEQGEEITAIKRGNAYADVTGSFFKLLDTMNFLAGKCPYAGFLSMFNVTEDGKGSFPYEVVTSFASLTEITELPGRDGFWSSLKNDYLVSDEEHRNLQKLWTEKGWQNLKDMLVWYNGQDVGPFMNALEKMRQSYIDITHMDPFHSGVISLPGMANKHLFQDTPPGVSIPLLGNEMKHVAKELQEQLIGGPSIVQHRATEVGKTKICGGRVVRSIIGHDANSQYLSCFDQSVPTGIGRHWKPSDADDHSMTSDFYPDDSSFTKNTFSSHEELFFLESVHFQESCGFEASDVQEMVHSFRGARQVKLGDLGIYVDGFIAPAPGANHKGHVFLYHGCYWHCHMNEDGNPCKLTAKNNMSDEQRKSKHQETLLREEYLKTIGYNVFSQYECEFKHILSHDRKQRNELRKRYGKIPSWEPQETISDFVDNLMYCRSKQRDMRRRGPRAHKTAENIIEEVRSDQDFFGYVKVDVSFPDHLRKEYDQFPMIFKHASVSRDDIGPHMKEYAESHGLLRQPRKCLISSHWATGFWATTPMLHFWLRKGAVVTRVYEALEFARKNVFHDKVKWCRRQREEADRGGEGMVEKGNVIKNISVSYYGTLIKNLSRYMDVRFMTKNQLMQAIRDPRFKCAEKLSDNVYEVESARREINWNIPILLGHWVLQTAKLKLLEFQWDFLDYYAHGRYQLLFCDTDSIYIALTEKTLDATIRANNPQLYEEGYQKDRKRFLVTEDKYKRKPGLWKVEFEGEAMFCLQPKMVLGTTPDEDGKDTNTKISCKGFNKKRNKFTSQLFRSVLANDTPIEGSNAGFRKLGSELAMYTQQKKSFAYLYIKRKTEDDGISTTALDL